MLTINSYEEFENILDKNLASLTGSKLTKTALTHLPMLHLTTNGYTLTPKRPRTAHLDKLLYMAI